MICKVKESVKKFGLIDEGVKSVAVGFSGGADSVCLLDVLTCLKDEYGIIIKAVHINHNIRGAEAERDELFVRNFCKKRGISLEVYSLDVPSIAKERKLSLEECGRLVRYECFDKAGCDAVAVAHTLSDSIETMIFNLARGTGAKGLSGINPKRKPNIIRPLIECTRQEIEAYCKTRGLDYVTDSTNLSDDYTRNHIRHNIIPAFEKINKDFNSAFLRAMNSIREEDEYIEKLANELLIKSRCENGYRISSLLEAENAVVKKCILGILKDKMSKPPEAKHIEACFSLLKDKKGKIELAKDLYIFADGDIISFCSPQKEVEQWHSCFVNGIAETPYGTISLSNTGIISADSFDADKVSGELYVSSRRSADRFTLKKRGVTKSVKKLFNEYKIPLEKRNSLAVLHDGENVVWIEDFGVNAMYIPDANSQKIITIKKDG